MRHLFTGTAVLLLTTAAGYAGGIETSRLSYGALFETGRYMELGLSSLGASVDGTYNAGPFAGSSTGNMAKDITTLSFAYKADINDRLSYAVLANQPYGADALYTQGLYAGLAAKWQSQQVAVMLKYDVADRASVYGGLRYVRSQAEINLASAAAPGTYYTANGPADAKLGYTIGAAYEIPDIALRVALTYESKVNHEFPTIETITSIPLSANTQTDVELPQSLTLDFQTGVAKDTLVFGSIRWAEWSKWQVSPQLYAVTPGINGGDPVVTGFNHDVLTYQIGVGRKISDSLSLFARAGYEKANGGTSSPLAPTDGYTSLGLGAVWTHDKMKVTGGVEYARLGDAVDRLGTVYTDNTAIGLGISVGYSF